MKMEDRKSTPDSPVIPENYKKAVKKVEEEVKPTLKREEMAVDFDDWEREVFVKLTLEADHVGKPIPKAYYKLKKGSTRKYDKYWGLVFFEREIPENSGIMCKLCGSKIYKRHEDSKDLPLLPSRAVVMEAEEGFKGDPVYGAICKGHPYPNAVDTVKYDYIAGLYP